MADSQDGLPRMQGSRSAAALPSGMQELPVGYSNLSIDTSGSAASRSRSAVVLANSYHQRDALQEHMRQQHEESQYRLLLARQAKQRAWRQRMAGSPYTVNLVGEAERVAEEMRVKQELEAWRKRYEERERERLRSEVVQSAMIDAQKLQQLHRDKMAVQLEQKRLRALRDVQRSEARALAVQGDIRRRVWEPTPEIREMREFEWQARRQAHQQRTAERMARLEAKAVAKQKATILRDQARHERVTNRTRQPMYSQASDPRFQL